MIKAEEKSELLKHLDERFKIESTRIDDIIFHKNLPVEIDYQFSFYTSQKTKKIILHDVKFAWFLKINSMSYVGLSDLRNRSPKDVPDTELSLIMLKYTNIT